ncbi:MAG TPA: hypothetical protein VGZ91_15460 [Candidatus Sulfotelmatobacter sp.]|jgi:hypothetical protein|nr:hypothetical protein [Candidatus Sulfotelmatobacter sp.]
MAASGERKRLPRGTRPPLLALGEAADLCVRLYEHAGGTAGFDLLSQLANNSVSSSTFIKKLSSLKAYGLVSEQNKFITLTDLGLAIAAPTDSEGSTAAMKVALLRVDVFSRIYERHRGKLLPADEFLRNIIQGEFGIPRSVADSWVRSFKDGARASGLLLERPDGKTQVREAAAVEASREDPSDILVPAMTESRATPRTDLIDVTVPQSASGQSSRLEVSGGRYASFYVPDKITKRDAEKLKGALAGLSAIIDSLVIDDSGSG